MNIANNLIKSDMHNCYEIQLYSLWSRIINLNDSMLILMKIIDFPFSLFIGDDNYFWFYTRTALFERCIMLTWSLVVDNNDGAGLTLSQLKNNLIDNYLNDAEKDCFKDRYIKLQFENRIKDLKGKIRGVRHNFIAHYNYEKAWENKNITGQDSLNIEELSAGLVLINDYFKLICLGDNYSIHNVEYIPGAKIGGKPVLKDIDKLLRNIILEDPTYTMPETNPNLLHLLKYKIDPAKMVLVNEARVDNGLPKIDLD